MKDENEGLFSIAEDNNDSEKIHSLGKNSAEDKEAITHLGSSYNITKINVSEPVTVNKAQSEKQFPMWIISVLVAIPLVLFFTISVIANKNAQKKDDRFLFNTVESKYFSLSHSSDYDVQSIIDKKIPFIEKHTLINKNDGQKTLSIIIKDVKFDYKIDENSAVTARRKNTELYRELPYKLDGMDGLYFKKSGDSFEHMVVVIDRGKSLLYEIMFFSPSNFADSQDTEKEFTDFLKNMTFF